MDYKKYYKGEYKLGKCDCWTLIQDIFLDEHNIKLPSYPFAVENHEKDFVRFVKANLLVEPLTKPVKGCIVHYSYMSEHVGYAVNNHQYIHRIEAGTKVQDIPLRYCKFYKIVEVLGE